MPVDTAQRRVSAADARTRVADMLRGAGVDDDIAELQATHLVEADLRGHPSHGIRRTVVLRDRIEAGLIVPNARPVFEWSARAALKVDGRLGLGPVSAYGAIDEILARIADTGVVVAALRRTHHIGMLAPYVEKLAAHGCIGIVMCSTEGLVHPWGGSGAIVGTNPLAVSVPAGEAPVVLDMSTALVSAGKILDYHERGRELPDGWAVDPRGRPTRDAAEAMRGAISPFGGAKGFALGLTLGSLVGLLTDTEYGSHVRGTLDTVHQTTKGDVIVAIDVKVLAPGVSMERLAAYLDEVRASGVDGNSVTVPGDRARDSRAEALERGFDVTETVWSSLEAGSRDETQGAGR